MEYHENWGIVTPIWLCFSTCMSLDLGTSFSAFVSASLLLHSLSLLTYLYLPIFICLLCFCLLTSTFSSPFLPIHLFKVRLSANHCILSLRIVKFLLPLNSEPSSFFMQVEENWSHFQKWVPLRKKKILFQTISLTQKGVFQGHISCQPDISLHRILRLVKNKLVKEETRLSGGERNETIISVKIKHLIKLFDFKCFQTWNKAF